MGKESNKARKKKGKKRGERRKKRKIPLNKVLYNASHK